MSGHESNLPYCCQEVIGRVYTRDRDSRTFYCAGIMLGDDDWYFVMYPSGEGKLDDVCFLSCVGDIESFGYTPVNHEQA